MSSPATEGCTSCHFTRKPRAAGGHPPFDDGRCTACHAGGSEHGAETRAPEERELGPLLLRDALPTRERSVLLRDRAAAEAGFVWIRAGEGSWRRYSLSWAPATRPAAIAPRLEVERRHSTLGDVAVVVMAAEQPFAARVQVAGKEVRTPARYFAAKQSLRVPLGASPPQELTIEIVNESGHAETHTLRLADAGGSRSEAGALAAEPRLLPAPHDGLLLRISTAEEVRLEIRAPARATQQPSGGVAARPGSHHAWLARPEFTGRDACLRCHPGMDHARSSHPLVTARAGNGYRLPADLPLGPGRQILCSTCHDPHGSSQHAFYARQDARRELCIQCHKESGPLPGAGF